MNNLDVRNSENIIQLLKESIIIEHRLEGFYRGLADVVEDDALRNLFKWLADDESTHELILQTKLNSYLKGEKFDQSLITEEQKKIDNIDFSNVLTPEIQEKIVASESSSALIYAVIELEKSLLKFYMDQMLRSRDEELRRFYQWFIDFESHHHGILVVLDDTIKDRMWFANKF